MSARSRLERALAGEPDDRAFLPFLVVFAVYLAIRGVGYDIFRLLVPLALLLLVPQARRVAALAALVVEVAATRSLIYHLSNHGFLEMLLLGLLAAVSTRTAAGRTAFVRTLMALFVVFVLWTGLKKLLHGFYPDLDYFTIEAASWGGSKFGEAFRHALGPADRATLEAYQRSLHAWALTATAGAVYAPPVPQAGAIPALSALFSIATLAAELGLPFLLIPRRTRSAAALGLAAFILCVEVVAREWHFALLFGALLLPFLPASWLGRFRSAEGDASQRPLPPLTLAAASLAVAVVAIWPAVQFELTRSWDLDPWKLGGLAMYAAPARWSAERANTAPPIEVRTAADPTWRPLSTREPGVPVRALEAEAGALLHAPHARGPAERIAAIVRARRPDATGIRIHIRGVSFDRSVGRFRLEEWVSEPP
ncbi:MAG TPA: hypothetical protein VHF22_07610 [Planctomycetota bacterium]|nr:hypothetical protein [Planctomycetota bacterium]